MGEPNDTWVGRLNVNQERAPLNFKIALEIHKVKPKNGISRIIYLKTLTHKITKSRIKALTGIFTRMILNLDAFKIWVYTKWLTKGATYLVSLPYNFTFIQEEDIQWVLKNGPWQFGKSGLILKKWYRGFRPEKKNSMQYQFGLFFQICQQISSVGMELR